MSGKIAISVLMAAYNSEKHIKEAINSILNQTHKNFELIILNDGSTDETFNLISNFKDNRIKVYNNTTNEGLFQTRTKLAKLAKNNIIAIMDSDDISDRYRLEKQLKYMIKYNLDLIGSNIAIIDQEGKLTGKKINFKQDSKNITCAMFFNNSFAHSSILFKKEILNNCKYKREYNLAEDYDFTSQVIMNGYKVGNVNIPLVKYRIHDHNITKDVNNLAKYEELILKNWILYLTNNNQEKANEIFLLFKNKKDSVDFFCSLTKTNYATQKFPMKEWESLCLKKTIRLLLLENYSFFDICNLVLIKNILKLDKINFIARFLYLLKMRVLKFFRILR